MWIENEKRLTNLDECINISVQGSRLLFDLSNGQGVVVVAETIQRIDEHYQEIKRLINDGFTGVYSIS